MLQFKKTDTIERQTQSAQFQAHQNENAMAKKAEVQHILFNAHHAFCRLEPVHNFVF